MKNKTGSTGLHSVTSGNTYGTTGDGFFYSISEDKDGFIRLQIGVDTKKHTKLPKKEIKAKLKSFAEHFKNLVT